MKLAGRLTALWAYRGFVIGMVAGRFFLMKKQIGWLSPTSHTVLGLFLISTVLLRTFSTPFVLTFCVGSRNS